jgi:hypothetical protein
MTTLSVRPETKGAISMGHRHPRESGGPGQPLESCGPWIPAFVGMTAELLGLIESFPDRR